MIDFCDVLDGSYTVLKQLESSPLAVPRLWGLGWNVSWAILEYVLKDESLNLLTLKSCSALTFVVALMVALVTEIQRRILCSEESDRPGVMCLIG